jgi:hypothetical protein
MWVHAIAHWLVANNFWVSVLAWCVFGSLTAIAAWRPLKRHQKTQAKIANDLDTKTPGGLTDVLNAVNKLRNEWPDYGDEMRERHETDR